MKTRATFFPFVGGAVVSALAFIAVYVFFVRTNVGQQIDESAFVGASLPSAQLVSFAQTFLGVVPIVALLVGMVIALPTVFIRRNLIALITGVITVVAINISAQVLKETILSRPELSVVRGLSNSLPSGHTAIAGSVSLLVFLVSAPRFRGLVAVLGSLFVIVTGAFTLVEQWHRPSDVIAAMVLVAFWGCCAGMVLRLIPPRSPQDVTSNRVRPLVFCALVAAAISLIAFIVTLMSLSSNVQHLFIAYVGGVAAIVGTGFLVAAGGIRLFRRVA